MPASRILGQKGKKMNFYPIWHKIQRQIPSSNGADAAFFRVYVDTPGATPFSGNEQLIYEGRAVQSPDGSGYIMIAVNDIVADWLNDFDPVPQVIYDGVALQLASLALAVRIDGSADGETWTTGTPFIFVPDWTYRKQSLWTTDVTRPKIMNAPIRAELTERSVIIATVVYQKGFDVSVELFNETESDLVDARLIDNPGTGVVRFSIADYIGDTIEAGDEIYFAAFGDEDDAAGPHFTILPACAARYELIYQNALGGYDTMLVRGPVTRSEAYDRQITGRSVPDNYPYNGPAREDVGYRTDVREQWTLPLGTFTDEEAARMFHLTGSRRVWLHDMAEDTLTPLTITNTECTDKTFRNQGRQRVSYTLTAETAAERQRR